MKTLLHCTATRFMKVRTYVEQLLHRNIDQAEILSYEIEFEGVRVIINTTTRGLSLKLKQQATWERAEISEVQTTKRGIFFAEKWLDSHVKVLG